MADTWNDITKTSKEEDNLIAIKAILATQLETLQEKKVNLDSVKEQAKSVLESNVELQAVIIETEQYILKQKEALKKAKNSYEYLSLYQKLKEIKDEIKEIEEEISSLILGAYKITGEHQIEINGQIIPFKIIGKVAKNEIPN